MCDFLAINVFKMGPGDLGAWEHWDKQERPTVIAQIVESSIENMELCSLPLVCLNTQQYLLEQGAAGDGSSESGPKKKKKKKKKKNKGQKSEAHNFPTW